MKHTTLTRAGVAGIALILAFALSSCSSGGAATSGSTGAVGATDDPNIQGGGEFCDKAVESLAAAGDITKASDDLSAAMTSGDVDALHTASQAVLDNSVEATAFYSLGAEVADDQATKDAFNGLSQFVAEYSVPMGQAGVDAASVPDFMAAITTLFTNPELQPLLASASGWAQTTHDFTVEYCGIS